MTVCGTPTHPSPALPTCLSPPLPAIPAQEFYPCLACYQVHPPDPPLGWNTACLPAFACPLAPLHACPLACLHLLTCHGKLVFCLPCLALPLPLGLGCPLPAVSVSSALGCPLGRTKDLMKISTNATITYTYLPVRSSLPITILGRGNYAYHPILSYPLIQSLSQSGGAGGDSGGYGGHIYILITFIYL